MSSLAPSTRSSAVLRAAALIAVIAAIDWRVETNVSLGFLYLFPMLVLGAWLERWQLGIAASVCTALVEVFDPFPFIASEGIPRVILVFAAFFGAGLFVFESAKNRRLEHRHVLDVETEIELRRDAEEQLRILVDSSPAAIFTFDASRKILLANEAAHQLLSVEPGSLAGRLIVDYLPALAGVPLAAHRATMFRTEMECRGRRSGGESFLASVWFSTYRTRSGPRLAAVVIDISEALRDREESSLEQFMAGSRILVSTVCHEIRNLCGAISAVHANLERTASASDDYRALGTLIAGLEHIAALELHNSASPNLSGIDLISLLDELRIIIEPSLSVEGVTIDWRVPESLPHAWADRHTLMQVFLNLVKNSARAMESSEVKRITIEALSTDRGVKILFQDSGPGVSSPANLFEPFHSGAKSTGIGLYLSRALVRAVKGELTYEPRRSGCCFAITLSAIEPPPVDNRISDDPETAPALAGRSHPVS
jgi:two-component system sensor kinase FixL